MRKAVSDEDRKRASAVRRKKWRDANPQKYYESHTDNRLRKQYGITFEQAKAMLANQGGVCANLSCGKPLAFGTKDKKTTAVVDHCHKEHVVRGVVCDGCNKALGHAYDNAQVLAGLVEYLRRER